VKPYHFFSKTGDINAPPALSKREDDNKTGFEFSGGGIKQLTKTTNQQEEKPKVAEADSTTDIGLSSKSQNDKLSKDLLLTDEESNSSTGKRDSDSDSSSSSQETEVSTPKPDVPHVFDDEEETSKEIRKSEEPKVSSSLPEPIPTENKKAEKEEEEKKTEAMSVDQVSEAPPTIEVDAAPSGEVAVSRDEVKEVKPEKVLSEEEKQFLLPDADDYLMYLEDILERIHSAFYKEYDARLAKGTATLPNVKEIIPSIRKNVLKVCRG